MVHVHYVGVAELTTVDVVVTEASFEEYFLPNSSAKVAMNKSDSGYWTVAAPGLGWPGNMGKIVELLVGSNMDFDPADFTKATDGPLVWGNGDITTGTTVTDFKDYLSLALRAHANLEVVA